MGTSTYNMDASQLQEKINTLPRARIGLYPTPFHSLQNLSKEYGINLYMKREDLAGPGTISGSKTRLAEFILGQAKKDGATHVITQGVHVTNSGLQFAAACNVAGITPILILTRDVTRHGQLEEYRGNLLLSKIMGVETHYLETAGGGYWDSSEGVDPTVEAIEAKRRELEAAGHRPVVVPTGGAHPLGFVAHILNFLELLEQSKREGCSLDYIYHTAGTGTLLPGFLAAKLLLNHPVKLRSIAICKYDEGGFMSPSIIVDRVKTVFRQVGIDPPADDVIRAEINIDQRFIGEDYAVPSPESTAAIKLLAKSDGVFVGPVYTGKGFAGMMDHIRNEKLPAGSNVVFIHTGDTGNLFEVSTVVGDFSGSD